MIKLIIPSAEMVSAPDWDIAIQDMEKFAKVSHKSEVSYDTEKAKAFISNLISWGHESPLEFVNISVLFKVGRDLTHELVRHRLSNFMQSSTRYIAYDKGVEIAVPWWAKNIQNIAETTQYISFTDYLSIKHNLTIEEKLWLNTIVDSTNNYEQLLKLGVNPEDARGILPTCTAAELYMQCNLRQWRNVFKLRASKHAHPDLRRIMSALLVVFKTIFPPVFDDIEGYEES